MIEESFQKYIKDFILKSGEELEWGQPPNGQSEKRIDVLNFDYLEVNNKKAKADLYGGSYLDTSKDMNWSTFQTNFDPLFGEKPKKVNVKFGAIYLTVEDKKTIELDATKEYPQTFEYAGSTISIDKVEVGQPTKVVNKQS